MHNSRTLLSLLLGSILFLSCTGAEGDKRRIPASKGLPSELLLIVDKAVWQSDLADTLKQITEGDVPGLMQHESYFRTSHVLTEHYGRGFITMHSKLYVRLNPKLKAAQLGIARDATAQPQLEVVVEAPNLDMMRMFLSCSSDYIREVIGDFQLEMRKSALQRKYSRKVYDDLKSVMGMTIKVPENIVATKKGKDFLWGGSNLNEKDLNVVVYRVASSTPLGGEDDLLSVIHLRDSVMKANIPGSAPDQWLETVWEKGSPVATCRKRTLDGREVLEVRGLWQMRNGALGGPFVALVSQRLNKSTGHSELLVSEGFVYSPGTDKRDLLRQLEAAIRTLR